MTTLLIIDDSESQRLQIRAAVEEASLFDEVIEADDGLKGLRILLEKSIDGFDVVVCRLEIAGLDGAQWLSALREHPATAAATLVCLTTQEDAGRRASLLESGASDLLTVPFHPAELVARLKLHLRLKYLQDELRIKKETLGRLSTRDGLTGLRTRRYVDEVLSVEFLRARRHADALTLLLGDLDDVKRVNDEHGQLAGDAALRGVSSILLHDLRKTDVAGRFGGREILVVLAQSDASSARILAERWRGGVEEARFPDAFGKPFRVTISIGVASLSEDMLSPESLVEAAEAALCRAKEAGRNRVELARPSGVVASDSDD